VAARRPVKRDGTLNCKRFDRYIHNNNNTHSIYNIICCFTYADCVRAASVVKTRNNTKIYITLANTRRRRRRRRCRQRRLCLLCADVYYILKKTKKVKPPTDILNINNIETKNVFGTIRL